MKNRSILSFLAIGALIAAPLLAEKIPDASMEHERLLSRDGVANGHSLRDVTTARNVGSDAFKDSNFASHMRDFDEDGRLAIMMNDRSSAGIGDIDFLPLGLTNGDRLEKIGKKDIGKKDIGKNHPVDVDHNGSSLPPVVVPEPEAFTLVLLGVSVLGMLLYRRNSL